VLFKLSFLIPNTSIAKIKNHHYFLPLLDAIEDKVSDMFMELASHQRLEILKLLHTKPQKASKIAKDLDATPQEVARNLDRLEAKGLISKNSEGNYFVTSLGTAFNSSLSLAEFVVTHKNYLERRDLSCLDDKFLAMLGMLLSSEIISGFVLVQDKIKSIYQNSTKYVCNVITEVSPDLFDITLEKCDKGIKIRNIFSKNMISTEERKSLVKNEAYKRLIQNQLLEKRTKTNLDVLVNLNEKEALLCLPLEDGRYDMSQALYSSNKLFHEWCLDYFNSAWNTSHVYVEK